MCVKFPLLADYERTTISFADQNQLKFTNVDGRSCKVPKRDVSNFNGLEKFKFKFALSTLSPALSTNFNYSR